MINRVDSTRIKPIVSVIIACRNEQDYVEMCMRSILGQKGLPGGLEIIVADGMSDDGTRVILERFKQGDERVQVVDNPGRIVSTGLNAAIRKAQGEFIVRMDVHTRYAPDYLCQCLTVLKQTGVDNVGGPAHTEGTNYIQSVICAAYHSPFSVGGARFHEVNYEGLVDTVPYGCWRREVFDRIGLFDEELVRNQDDEFNLRLIRAGGKIWQSPRIKSWYAPRASFRALFQQYMQYGYWKVRVIQKHKLPGSLRHLVPGCFMILLILLPLLSLWWPHVIGIWLALLAAYGLCNITASVLAAKQKAWRLFPILPLVFATYHFGYGYGFLRGIWDFVILRRLPRDSFVQLTRAATDEDN